MIQIILTEFALLLATVVLLGYYLSRLVKIIAIDWYNNPPRFIERIKKLLSIGFSGVSGGGSYKSYLKDVLFFNIVLIIVDTVLLWRQDVFFKARGLSLDLAFNTAVSFATNTNLQHYAGEYTLSNMAQAIVITSTMFLAPAIGLAVSFAFMRALKGLPAGFFYFDLVAATIFLLTPISIIAAIILASLGVPQSFREWVSIVNPYSGVFKIRLGPVASFEAIKLLGTNGGGFYSANSAHPFENPNGLTNFVESVLMMLIPTSLLFAYGRIIDMKRGYALTTIVYIMASMIFLVGVLNGVPLYGRLVEPRLGYASSLFFNTASLLSNTGATASSLEAMKPSAIIAFLLAMFIQAVPGSDGVGLLYLLIYLFIVVFISSLMIGKLPRFLNMPLSTRVVKLSVIVFLIHPVIILIPTAIALVTKQYTSFAKELNPLVYTMILYEYTSSAANNGSGYLGVLGNTVFWNLSTALVMLAGRLIPIALFLIIADELYKSKRTEVAEPVETKGLLFIITSVVMIVILTVLTFFPFLVLGPMILGG
ncbi:potassium-transporting ATPase subunit KdpA [Thermogladius sp. 4427co]|uniref:potassium-transporting ATPase subunit KdpA n=1 Tax=Thermogladius sp. 4427co TaxID=3450718 RepID=UPI003F7AC121